MKQLTVLFLTVFICFSLNAQKSDIQTIEAQEQLAKYFEFPREQLYLHLNKSTYVKGETLWFKGYVYDLLKKQPSLTTKNIEVGLYNSDGVLLKKQLFLGESGYAKGQFEIDSLFNSGDYYIRATTNWLRNFKENHDYVQKLRVINQDSRLSLVDALDVTYDLQFMPEGGHLIEGVENNVGVLLKDSNGKGVPFREGAIFNDKGRQVTTFKTNLFGIGNFYLNTLSNNNYSAEVKLENGDIVRAKLPLLESKGLALRIMGTRDKDLYIRLNTNKKTYKEIAGKPFYILTHQEGKNSIGKVSFKENQLTLSTRIKRDDLYPGINTITILNTEGKPILERLVFNNSSINYNTQEFVNTKTEKSNDSISFHFSSIFSGKLDKEPYNISVSVLPENTISYSKQDNIVHSFFLKPYIKGFAENPSYYFEKPSLEKYYNLDLLLLTQGWSRYEWGNIFSSPPTLKYKFEQGISLKTDIQKEAFFQKRKQKRDVLHYIHPTAQQEPVITPIGDMNTILIDNLYFTEGDSIKTSIIKPSGELVKSVENIEIFPKKRTDTLVITPSLFTYNLSESYESALDTELNEFIKSKEIVLEEVVVKKKREFKKQNILSYKSSSYNQVDVDENVVYTFPLVLDIIRFKGFNVQINPLTNEIVIAQRFPTFLSPLLVFDGLTFNDFQILSNLRTTQIENIYANPRDISRGIRGAGGLIEITSRKTDIDYSAYSHGKIVSNFSETPLDFAFQKAKKFYTPTYTSFETSIFDWYGVVHWEPEIKVEENGDFVVKTANIPNKNYNFYFEGMSASGALISNKVKWSHSPN